MTDTTALDAVAKACWERGDLPVHRWDEMTEAMKENRLDLTRSMFTALADDSAVLEGLTEAIPDAFLKHRPACAKQPWNQGETCSCKVAERAAKAVQDYLRGQAS